MNLINPDQLMPDFTSLEFHRRYMVKEDFKKLKKNQIYTPVSNYRKGLPVDFFSKERPVIKKIADTYPFFVSFIDKNWNQIEISVETLDEVTHLESILEPVDQALVSQNQIEIESSDGWVSKQFDAPVKTLMFWEAFILVSIFDHALSTADVICMDQKLNEKWTFKVSASVGEQAITPKADHILVSDSYAAHELDWKTGKVLDRYPVK